YFFWDAYLRGLLLPHSERDARLEDRFQKLRQGVGQPLEAAGGAEAVAAAEALAELQRRCRLGSPPAFNDLWPTLADRVVFTAWVDQASRAGSFFWPRRCFGDTDHGAWPLEERYRHDNERIMQYVRATMAGLCVKDERQNWVEDTRSGDWTSFEQSFRCAFPKAIRGRTLLLVRRGSPYYIDQLSAEERACYARLMQIAVGKLQHLGFSALEVGAGYTAADYGDLQHLTASGGEKLAEAVAPQVRALARQLGYVPAGFPRGAEPETRGVVVALL